ncbi:MAG: HAD hydrolase-like protein [Leptospiraceae bacterium]|nr:HAD hydrolase-like protein [Leptospiraceae bacterium]MCP5494765.1 HAD hydrolase-like protein [Leptospiraceae bacterium]
MNTNITFQKPDLILIDFDGVIAKNSPDFAVHLFHQALNEITPIKVEFIIDFFRLAMSFSVKDSLEFLFKSLGLSQDEKKTVTENYKNKVSNNLNLFHINKDFYCFIEFCKNNNIKYKVFSLAVDSRLSLIKLEPNDFYNLEDMSKANVKTFLKVKKNLNVENVSYIDDSPLGLRTGKLSGMNTIMMYNSLFGVSEYLIYKEYIDYSVSSFSEIQTIFSNLLSN